MSSEFPREAVSCDLCGADDTIFLIVKNGFRVVRCRGCHLVYVNPRPDLKALESQYSIATYVEHQEERADDASWHPAALARLALVERHQPHKGTLLDVGCSTGWFMNAASIGGWSVTGIDVSASAVARDRSRGLDAHVATLERHNLARGSFDVITMFDSIEHMPSPMRALRAARELLRENGLLVITTPNVDGLLPFLIYQLFGRTMGLWEHPTPPGHIYQFSGKTLAAALHRAGFDEIFRQTERIPLDHTVSELENVLVDALKRRGHRPPDPGPDLDLPAERVPGAAAPGEPPRGFTRLARRMVRQVARAGSWAMACAIAAPAPMLGLGDSLLVLARKR